MRVFTKTLAGHYFTMYSCSTCGQEFLDSKNVEVHEAYFHKKELE